jgi:hypothetical protein
MFKGARVPEKLFRILMWLVSIVFAGFLIGLGSKILADSPRLDERLNIEQFADRAALDRIDAERKDLDRKRWPLNEEREKLRLAQGAADQAFTSERESLENWIATRRSTQNPGQDAELVARTQRLDALKAEEREAAAKLAAIDQQVLALDQRSRGLIAERDEALRVARPAYHRALNRQELTIFGVRLAITLPLLALAGWFVARQRSSEYWPLLRGFVIAAMFAFFVELVPYLPSYGGYVRYGVGIVLTALVGHYGIRWMRGYLERRRAEERRTETERRSALSYEQSLRKMAANVCPGCERPVAAKGVPMPNCCMHCGMRLFESCGGCGERKNAFFLFCPSCGTGKVPAAASG